MHDLKGMRLIAVDENKEVESVHYTDGSVDMLVDMPKDVIGWLYSEAHLRGCEVNDLVVDTLSEYLSAAEEVLDSEDHYDDEDYDDSWHTNLCPNCGCDCKSDN